MDDIVRAAEASAARLNLFTPASRFVFGFAVASALSWTLQPKGQFENGSPRPFAAWSTTAGGVTPTKAPWFATSALVGGALALFI